MDEFATQRKMWWSLQDSDRAGAKRKASGLPADAYSEGMFLAATIIEGAS